MDDDERPRSGLILPSTPLLGKRSAEPDVAPDVQGESVSGSAYEALAVIDRLEARVREAEDVAQGILKDAVALVDMGAPEWGMLFAGIGVAVHEAVRLALPRAP